MSADPFVYAGSDAYVVPDPGPVLTIGNFDGVHRGHRALLARARQLAGRGAVCAVTFDPSPREVLRPDRVVPAIQSLEDRVATLRRAGADQVVIEPFDRTYAQRDAESWARDILVGRLGATGVVVGWDFRFGRGRSGGIEALRSVVHAPVEQVGGVQYDGDVVSSTRIREAVLTGRVDEAARLLVRPHELVGVVVPGDGRGRTVGVPTANVVVDTALVPPAGVYAVRVLLDGAWRDGVANLGDRPTFGPTAGRLEVHVLDGAPVPALEGRRLRVGLVARLRDERRFDGLDALVAQIRRDIEAARGALQEPTWKG